VGVRCLAAFVAARGPFPTLPLSGKGRDQGQTRAESLECDPVKIRITEPLKLLFGNMILSETPAILAGS
jgi:hypothetical protein